MKIVVIGCTHAGTAAVLNARQTFPDAEISVYEINDNISFLSCGIALYVGGVVDDAAGLFYSSPEQLKAQNIDAFMRHEVTAVDFKRKTIDVKNLETGETFDDVYDKLIITAGSWPIVPKLEGIELDNILLCKNYDHAKVIIDKAVEYQNITVIGAGYIGVELVEALQEQGKTVTLIDAQDRIMSKYLDKELTDIAENAFTSRGVHVALDEFVTGFKGEAGAVTTVCTDKSCYETELVILCIGFKPNTKLFVEDLEVLKNGAIVVDNYMRTSMPNVFAAGDCCAVFNNVMDKHVYMPLATDAVRMGTIAAKNLKENSTKYMGTQGTSGIKIYEHNIASTGLTAEEANKLGYQAKTVTHTDNYRPEFMPTNDQMTVKLVYDFKSRQILGAQIYAKVDMTPYINTLSVAIQNNMTVEELAYVDFFFQPHFNKPWNILNTTALKADK